MFYNKPLDNAEQEQSEDNIRPNQEKSNTRYMQINKQKDQDSLKNKDCDR